MVRLDKVRSDLQKLLEKEQALQCVEVRADTLDEALADAAVQLGTRVAYLEYEVLERALLVLQELPTNHGLFVYMKTK